MDDEKTEELNETSVSCLVVEKDENIRPSSRETSFRCSTMSTPEVV